MNYLFKWDKEERKCICTITTQYGEFKGEASCHPDDLDMKSKRTGEQLAYSRAKINIYRHERDCILKPKIAILKHLISIINMKQDTTSFAAKTIKHQLELLNLDLKLIKYLIKTEREYVRNYTAKKEKIYQKIRSQEEN